MAARSIAASFATGLVTGTRPIRSRSSGLRPPLFRPGCPARPGGVDGLIRGICPNSDRRERVLSDATHRPLPIAPLKLTVPAWARAWARGLNVTQGLHRAAFLPDRKHRARCFDVGRQNFHVLDVVFSLPPGLAPFGVQPGGPWAALPAPNVWRGDPGAANRGSLPRCAGAGAVGRARCARGP